MKGKRNDNRGETLVEVLASILIGSLSVALLFSMAMAAGNMDRGARAVDEEYYEAFNQAEIQTSELTAASSAVTVSGGFSSTAVDVVFYGGVGALSYALKDTGEGGAGGP